jgi:Zinc knuckle
MGPKTAKKPSPKAFSESEDELENFQETESPEIEYIEEESTTQPQATGIRMTTQAPSAISMSRLSYGSPVASIEKLQTRLTPANAKASFKKWRDELFTALGLLQLEHLLGEEANLSDPATLMADAQVRCIILESLDAGLKTYINAGLIPSSAKLYQKLNSFYGTIDSAGKRTLRKQFDTRSQGPDEDVHVYVADKIRMARELDFKVLSCQVQYCIAQGLHDTFYKAADAICERVCKMKPMTDVEIHQILMNTQNTLVNEGKWSLGSEQAPTVPANAAIPKKFIKKKSSMCQEPACSKSTHHLFRDCPLNTCNNCGVSGHLASRCPQKEVPSNPIIISSSPVTLTSTSSPSSYSCCLESVARNEGNDKARG